MRENCHKAAFPVRRTVILAVCTFLWVAAIAFRLINLQILDYGKYVQRAQRQQQRTIDISPRRGVVYDRNFHELAMSVQVDSVFIAPGEMPEPDNTLSLLSKVLKLDEDALRARMRAGRQFVWIKRKVEPAEAARVQALNLKGVYLQKENKRYYPKGELAAHLLGYVGMDENGLAGIEQEFDKQVRGQPGTLLVQADAKHRWYGRREAKAPDAGDNVVLTIDEKIQFIVEKELDETIAKTKAKGATVIVMDSQTGDILAMANRPTFNPNSHREVNPEVWKNRAVSENYEPGSTMKIITLAAALEEKLTHPDEVIDCQMGSITIFGHTIRDHKPFGLLTVTGVMTHSSDVGAIKMGLRLGDERFYRYIRSFGLGQATGVELPGEERGLMRPPERWTKSSVGAISMGQELGATALQMTAATNVIATGGLWHRPRIVRQLFHQGQPSSLTLETTVQASGQTRPRAPTESRRVLSGETALKVRRMMEEVVLSGTGKAAHLRGYTSAGKTGTAQKYDPNTGTYSKTDYVASFIGFAPVNNPAVTIAVILDSAVGLHQGGQIAAPLFKRVAEQVLAYLEVPPEFAVSKEPAPAVDLSQVADFAPQSEFETLKPTSASIAPEGKAEATSVVDLEGARTAPNFLGKTARAVAEQALAQGLDVELVGSGVAREQIPPPGGRLLPGRKVAVKFAR